MEDVENARELVEQRMRDKGLEESIFENIDGLLERFDSERENAISGMLDQLEAPGWSDLRDRWSSACERADSLLDDLESEIVDALGDSQANAMSPEERMAAIGPVDFLAGERKVWQQIARGDITDVAVLTGKLLDTDIQVIKKCQEDLQKAREGDTVVQALIQKNFGSITTSIKDLIAKYSLTAGPRLLVVFMRDASTKDLAKQKLQEIEKLLAENYEAAKQKRVFRQILLDNIDLLTKAREQLSEEWIDELYSRGETAARGLRDAGRSGDYEAADWEEFGEACIRALAERRDAAKEQSNQIYEELLPAFIDANTKAFAALTDDPATLADWTSDMQEDFKSIQDILEAEDEYREELGEGAYAEAAAETLRTIRQQIADGLELVTSRTKASDDEVKR